MKEKTEDVKQGIPPVTETIYTDHLLGHPNYNRGKLFQL